VFQTRRAGLLASAAALLIAAPAQADPAETVETIIIETTRTEIPAFTYPGQASLIDRETIELTGAEDLDALLHQIPGVQAGAGPRRTGQTLTVRGQSRENVTLLIDGARQNFNSAHDGVVFVDPALLASVEAVRGPASALYGSGASGGVIAFRTADPSDLLDGGQSWGGRLSAGHRSGDDQFSLGGSFYARDDDFDVLAHLSRRESGDIRLGSGDDLPADDESLASLLKIGADLGDGMRAELSWQGFDGEAVEPNNGQGNATVGGLNPLVNKDIGTDTLQLNAEIAPPSIGWLDLNATLYQTTSGVNETEAVSGRTVDRNLDSWGLRIDQRFAFQLGDWDAALTVGGEIYEDEQSGFDSTAPGDVRGGVPDASTAFSGVFAQLELTAAAPFGLPGELVVLPGIRADEYESTSAIGANNEDSATSGRFGVSYAPTENVVLFANWAEAFRAPSVNEIYLDGTHFSLPHPVLGPAVFITNEFIANPDLRPETTETVEVGVGFDFDGVLRPGDRLELKTSYFETQAEDLINLSVNFAFDPTCFAPPFFSPCSAGTSDSANVADATLTGFEASLAYETGPFALTAIVSETDGSDDSTGDPVGALTPLRAVIDGRYVFEQHDLLVGARLELAGDFDKVSDPAEARDGYAVTDLYARWRPVDGSPLTLTGGVDNVFDEDYSRVFPGASEAGRSARIGVSWTFGG
jgi:hemoglobin/transferrin/lactoferrin receptor protein